MYEIISLDNDKFDNKNYNQKKLRVKLDLQYSFLVSDPTPSPSFSDRHTHHIHLIQLNSCEGVSSWDFYYGITVFPGLKDHPATPTPTTTDSVVMKVIHLHTFHPTTITTAQD